MTLVCGCPEWLVSYPRTGYQRTVFMADNLGGSCADVFFKDGTSERLWANQMPNCAEVPVDRDIDHIFWAQ